MIFELTRKKIGQEDRGEVLFALLPYFRATPQLTERPKQATLAIGNLTSSLGEFPRNASEIPIVVNVCSIMRNTNCKTHNSQPSSPLFLAPGGETLQRNSSNNHSSFSRNDSLMNINQVSHEDLNADLPFIKRIFCYLR